MTAFWSYLNPNSPKHFPPSLTLGLKAHMKNFSRQRVCVIPACLCSHLVQHRRGLRHQIRAADLPGKSPVGRGAHGSLKGLFGFLWVYLGLSRFIWVYLGLFEFICFTVQAHLCPQKESLRNTMGAEQTLLVSSCHDLTEALLVCFFTEFWQSLTCPPAGLCCLGCLEGWVTKGQQTCWPDWNNSELKARNVLFCVPCCPSPAPEAEPPILQGTASLGWAGAGGC